MISRIRKEYIIPIHEFKQSLSLKGKVIRIVYERDFDRVVIEEEVKDEKG